MLGKRVSCIWSFNLHSAVEGWALGLEHFLPRGSPHSPRRAYALCGNVFSCFMFSEYSFVLLKCVHQGPSVKPSAFSLSNSLGDGLWHERGAHKPFALCWLPGGPTGHEGPLSMIGAELALTVLHVSKALFHSVLEYVVFFDTKMQWEAVFGVLPLGMDSQCMVF